MARLGFATKGPLATWPPFVVSRSPPGINYIYVELESQVEELHVGAGVVCGTNTLEVMQHLCLGFPGAVGDSGNEGPDCVPDRCN